MVLVPVSRWTLVLIDQGMWGLKANFLNSSSAALKTSRNGQKWPEGHTDFLLFATHHAMCEETLSLKPWCSGREHHALFSFDITPAYLTLWLAFHLFCNHWPSLQSFMPHNSTNNRWQDFAVPKRVLLCVMRPWASDLTTEKTINQSLCRDDL